MSPRTPKQYEEIREEKRNLIMSVALEHFAREGFHNTPISHIAKHAGISKGLLYNYFESKEELLVSIIDRSMDEVAKYFDPDHDGYLTENEFEMFIRKLFMVLREKLSFWRLFYQLLMQQEVRSLLLKSALPPVKTGESLYTGSSSAFLTNLASMISDYFLRKKEMVAGDYDPQLEMNMFIYTIEGFAMVTVYMDEVNEIYYNKSIDRIIELYK